MRSDENPHIDALEAYDQLMRLKECLENLRDDRPYAHDQAMVALTRLCRFLHQKGWTK